MMRFPFPAFVPVPSPEAMHLISIVSLSTGIALAGVTAVLLFLGRKNGSEGNKKRLWVLLGAGALLILNHGIQLLF